MGPEVAPLGSPLDTPLSTSATKSQETVHNTSLRQESVIIPDDFDADGVDGSFELSEDDAEQG